MDGTIQACPSRWEVLKTTWRELKSGPHSRAVRYGFALAVIAAAEAIRAALGVFGALPPYLTLYPAVLVVTVAAGFGPGMLSILLAMLITVYFTVGAKGRLDAVEQTTVIFFFIANFAMVLLAERLRRARDAAAAERQRLVVELRDEKEWLARVLDSIGDEVYFTDPQGRYRLINAAGLREFNRRAPASNIPLEEAIQGLVILRADGTPRPIEEAPPLRSLAGEVVEDEEQIVLTPRTGELRHRRVSSAPVRDDRGNIIGAVAVVNDMTERKRAQAALHASEARFRAMFEDAATPMSVTLPDGILSRANQAYCDMVGYREEELIGGNFITMLIHPLDREACDECRTRLLAGEIQRFRAEIRYLHKDGRIVWRDTNVAVVHDPDGSVAGLVSQGQDITARKKAEQTLRRREAELREIARRKDIFIATLSHELRNPLAPIRTSAQLLENPDLAPEDIARCRSIIARQVSHMGSLLDDLLDVSRLDRGMLALKKERAPLQRLLDAAIEATQPLIAAKAHRLVVDVPAMPLVLEADPVRLTQVVSNLLANAAKYTASGGHIRLGARVSDDGVDIFVHDNGIGLDAADITQIFNMFVQIGHDDEHAMTGLGIGLALSKAIAELHGGRIAAKSEGRGCGSTFTLTLPIAAIVEQESLAPEDDKPLNAARSMRVLIADDNRDSAESLAMLLKLMGHETHVVYSGTDALEAARHGPDVAVFDIGMPGMSGYELAQHIRAEAWGRDITLVAMTGWGSEDDKRKARAAGFDHHLTKPADIAEIERLFAGVRAVA